jgi:hypothetical protein
MMIRRRTLTPTRTRDLPLLLTTLATILALSPWRSAGAHSAEFILAKVTAREGRVELELTVDCSSENPMIASEAEAHTVLTRVLRARGSTSSSFAATVAPPRELAALAPLHFERRTQIDPEAPIPRDPTEDATKPHRLVCATWSWNCPADKITFEVPPDAGQSLILWTPAEQPGQQPRWVMLVGGDISPEIPVPRRPVSFPWLAVCACVGLVGVGVPVVRGLRRNARLSSLTCHLVEI